MAHLKYGILPLALVFLSACETGIDASSDSATDDDLDTTISAPGPADFSDTPLSQVALRPAVDCTELKSRFIENWTESLLMPYRNGDSQPVVLLSTTGPQALTMESSADSPDQVSQTNVQEQGVDESDYVKSDSNGNLYVAHQNTLLIEQGFPPDAMVQQAELDLGGHIAGIYLEEASNTLVAMVNRQALIYLGGVVAQVNAVSNSLIVIDRFKPSFDIVVIDVSNLSAPVISNRIRIDGWLVSSRRVGQRLHVLSRQNIYPDRWLYSGEDVQSLLDEYHKYYLQDDDSAYTAVVAKIRALLLAKFDATIFDSLLPKVTYPLLAGNSPAVILDCDSIFTPAIGLVKSGLMTMSSLDVDGNNLSQLGLLGNGWLTYATQNDFFFAQNSSGWWWTRWQRPQSVIHHISISDVRPKYIASGMVPGFINDSFSMSFHNGDLRVATTSWGDAFAPIVNRPSNHLSILRDDGFGVMKTIGAVREFAPGEQIFSARFFFDKAFIVTFRRVDPLFAFDLSAPENPRIVGELKIPGFSHYIHAIDTNTLLTIGRDGDNSGLTDDIAIKLFDVSDLSAMRLLDNYVPNVGGYSWSSANWDHHAFTYYAPLNLLSIPIITYDNQSGDYFSGIIALDIDPVTAKISELGRVDHEDLLQQSCLKQIWPCGPKIYSIAWLSQPNRSIVMQAGTENYLYSISNIGVKATNLADFDLTVGSLLFPPRNGLGDYYLF
jgi:hypothetical protein